MAWHRLNARYSAAGIRRCGALVLVGLAVARRAEGAAVCPCPLPDVFLCT